MSKLSGCCYQYPDAPYFMPEYLPQLKIEANATIVAETCTVKLRQRYCNPKATPIEECVYTFPLYDGVSVVKFTCSIGDKVLRGVVTERQEAKDIYDEAKSRGETAGLFEQSLAASDVFTTSLGNVPANEIVTVEIEYIGELKHDLETDGVRFILPTSIAPRYGGSTMPLPQGSAFKEAGFNIIVDVDMPEETYVRGIQSPTHPIAVSMGSLSMGCDKEPRGNRASASLTQRTVSMDKDFILLVNWDQAGSPKAILEHHPTIPNQRALMTTFVPKFALPAAHPEIIFVVDRSGSMGENIPTLISAMKLFLQSLPLGTKFNIMSFGSNHSLLFSQSMSYTQESLKEALAHVSQFQANLGGTQTLAALEAAVESSWKDIPCELMLLTDGDIWDQASAFQYINTAVAQSSNGLRVFNLGIGDGVSSAFIEGIARAGNGFSQTCTNDEKIDKKVVRMLKGGLSPHLKDCTLEVEFEETDDDLEMIDQTITIEKSCLEGTMVEKPQTEMSLFDQDAKPDDHGKSEDSHNRFANVPMVKTPTVLQAPYSLPALFPFNRTTAYLLLAPETIGKIPKSITLRAKSPQGPLSLTIPVVPQPRTSATLHQLAARKAMQELEEGRGWIYHAKTEDQQLLKDKHASTFGDMVEREAVQLGVKYQVGGKWCSFVAVEGDVEKYRRDANVVEDDGRGFVQVSARPAPLPHRPAPRAALASRGSPSFGSKSLPRSKRRCLPPKADNSLTLDDTGLTSYVGRTGGGRGGGGYAGRGGYSFASECGMPRGPPPASSVTRGGASYGVESAHVEDNFDALGGVSSPRKKTSREVALAIVDLQSFSGTWSTTDLPSLSKLIEARNLAKKVKAVAGSPDVFLTMVVITYLEKILPGEKDIWELVVEKGRAAVQAEVTDESVLSTLWSEAYVVV